MYFSKITLFLPLLAICGADIENLNTEKCGTWDSACIKRISQRLLPILSDGIPDLGTRRLDPLRIKHLHFNEHGRRSDLDNIIMCGFGKATINKASLDIFSKHYRVRFTIPKFTINATYVTNGFLDALPFNGKGDLHIKASDVEIDIIAYYDLREDGKGRKFLEFNKYYYSFDTISGCSVTATNLNSNSDMQSDAVNAYMEKNWKSINAQAGRLYLNPFLDAVSKAVKDVMHLNPTQNYLSDY